MRYSSGPPSHHRSTNEVEVLSKYNDSIVAAKQKNILALAFHPELTDDYRIHHYF